MSIDDILLMSYADGTLDAARRLQVEAAVAQSAELAERLSALHASVLPFGAAFSRQNLPAVPAQLVQRVEDLSRVSVTSAAPIAPASLTAFPSNMATRMVVRSAQFFTKLTENLWPRYAMAFAAGVFSFGVVVHQWPSLLPSSSGPSLVQAVADYHGFYARETVLSAPIDAASDRALLASAKDVDGLNVSVPDLRSAGLEFKRVQRLRFNDSALIQIVYLPERGKPVALCITLDARADEAVRLQQVGKVAAASWRQGQMVSILVGADALPDLGKLGERIAKGEMPVLYGS